MRARTIHKEEQLQLIMECRSSGLTDYQWCIEHNIRPGTFYNWISRFRKEGYPDIPEPLGRESAHKARQQEAVKLELTPYAKSDVLTKEIEQNACISESFVMDNTATIEILTKNASIRFTNQVNPKLLEAVLQTVGDLR